MRKIITLRHARAAGYCSTGMRAFAQRHRLDWRKFRKQGIPADDLLKTGDAMAIKVCRGK